MVENACAAHWSAELRKPSHAIEEDEVHVWQATLGRTQTEPEDFSSILAADEKARANRFVFERDRRRFIAARGMLRILLARYLGREPSRLVFQYSAYGKPFLSEDEDSRLSFNLSHSHEIVLFAFSRGRRLGIDVERIRPELATEELARRFFSKHEVDALEVIPPHARTEAFYACWTRKEAYVKACGEGLHIPFETFDVSIDLGERPRLLRVASKADEPERWTVEALSPSQGYVGAVVFENSESRPVRLTYKTCESTERHCHIRDA